MPIAKNIGGDFKPLPAGTHVARCFAVISLGTQPSNNPQFAPAFKVMLMWEVPDETVDMQGVATPMTISKEYTLSLNEKANLRRDLQSWRGKEFTAKELEGFDVANVCGAPCMLSVIHKANAKGSTYANIASISALAKSVKCAEPFHKYLKFEIEHGQTAVFKALPEWISKKILNCGEWTHPAAAPQGSAETPHDEDGSDEQADGSDIPF